MTTEAKVGAFTLAGLLLLAGVLIMLSGIKLGGTKGYTIYAGFKQVIGVEPQSVVRLSGCRSVRSGPCRMMVVASR